MQSVSPVFTEESIPFEKVIALDQPQYLPIVIMPLNVTVTNNSEADLELANGVRVPVGGTYLRVNMMNVVRFRFSDEEREAIAAGADLIVTEVVFGGPFTPIQFQFCYPSESPVF